MPSSVLVTGATGFIASRIIASRFALSFSDWIALISFVCAGLQYAPRLNWPAPLSSGQAISAFIALCAS